MSNKLQSHVTTCSLSLLVLMAIGSSQLSCAANPSESRRYLAESKSATTTRGFSDIDDIDGEKQITDLVRLGVIPASGAKFEPDKPVTRGEFVTWLVKANNILRPDAKIKTAAASATPSFPDVPATSPQFRYIQGMANAGWSIGYDDKTFKPAKELTREEMIAIKTPVDVGRDLRNEDRATIKQWADYDKISPRFKGAMCFESSWEPNWVRCFGKTKACNPQQTVTRAEAAICVWQVGYSDSAANPDKLKK